MIKLDIETRITENNKTPEHLRETLLTPDLIRS